MKLVMVIDSMELNGGSSMFLEMANGFMKYHTDIELIPIVVSKTGNYGRKRVTSTDLAKSYGVTVPCMNYEAFDKYKDSICSGDKTLLLHHRLGCTKPMKVSCPYVVINHTVEYPHRMKKFRHADKIVSVCEYIKKITTAYTDSTVILNGVENDYIEDIEGMQLSGNFKSGRCHRLAASKFSRKSLDFLESLKINDHKHFLVGPSSDDGRSFRKYRKTQYLGAIFNREKKMSFIKSLDIYYYDSTLKEGASIAILEALACGIPVICRPRGGNKELIINKKNGFLFESQREAISAMKDMTCLENLKTMKKQVKDDFNDRLHIKHSLSKYVDIFKELV